MSFAWMFDALSLELIVETAALDNIRTAKLLDHLGFVRKGEITSTRPDGTTRASLVWEITKEEWREQHTPPSC
jgi:RimJ/RimL family protein N-acetyltransferase